MPLLSAARFATPRQTTAGRLMLRLGVGVFVINALIGLVLFSVLQRRAAQLEDKAVTAARNLALVLQANLRGSITRVDMALLNGEDEVMHQMRQGGINKTALNKYLARLKDRVPEPDSLRISDARGNVIFGTGLNGKDRISIADREYFQQLRDNPNAGLLISPPVWGKISQKWVVVFARRLSAPDGRFAGIILAPIDTAYLSQSFRALDVGPHGLVVLRNNSLDVIMRHPPAPRPNVGRRIILPELEALHNSGANEGVYRAVSPVDGIERISAYGRIPSNGLNLTVALARQDFLAGMHDDRQHALVFFCCGLLISLLSAIFVYRSWLRREEALLARQSQERRMRAFANVSSDWFWEQDKEFRFIWFSEGMQAKTNLDPQKLLGRTCWELAHAQGESELAEIKDCLQRHQSIRDWRLTLRSHTGELCYFSLSGDPIFDPGGAFLGYLGSGKDVTASVHVEKHLRHIAHHDPLTGLPNRMLFDDRVERALLVAERTKSHLALMFIDLDRFKLINDEHGHTAGDALLVEMARRMRDNVRASDTVARIGGDEFIVLLPEIENRVGALQVGEKIREALRLPFENNGIPLRTSCSIGIVIYPDHGGSAEALARHADAAMYQAKLRGRNAVVVFDPSATT